MQAYTERFIARQELRSNSDFTLAANRTCEQPATSLRLPNKFWQNWPLRTVIDAAHPLVGHLVVVVAGHLVVMAVEEAEEEEVEAEEVAHHSPVHHPVHPAAVHLAVVVEAAAAVVIAVVAV